MPAHPRIVHPTIDAVDVRGSAEFYRDLLGLAYRAGDEPPTGGQRDDAHWLVLVDGDGAHRLAFQRVDRLPPSTWPSHDVPMRIHLDLTVADLDELQASRSRAEALGARVLSDRTDAPDPFYVLADPSGHPFCVVAGW